MSKNDLLEYADYLLKTAIFKVQNIKDAEDLVQDTLMEALLAIEKGKVIDNPKNWLVTSTVHCVRVYFFIRIL